jgi:hypothetical protein
VVDILRYYPGIYLEGLRKTSINTVDIPNQYLLNTSQTRFLFSQLVQLAAMFLLVMIMDEKHAFIKTVLWDFVHQSSLFKNNGK